jgi:two-component system phosphate regulon sensor histidine kinase PhoR
MIDAHGNTLAHPDDELEKQQKNLQNFAEVNKFLQVSANEASAVFDMRKQVSEINNEFGVPSLVTTGFIPRFGWGIISQVPISDTTSETNKVLVLAGSAFIATSLLILLFSIWITKKIVSPIEQLKNGAILIGNGCFDYQLNIKTNDEIEKLANSFNKMAAGLRHAFAEISAERNKLQVTVEGIKDAVVAVDQNYKIILFNKAAEKFTGLNAKDILYKPIEEAFEIRDSDDKKIPPTVFAPVDKKNFEGVIFSGVNLRIISSLKKEITANITASTIYEAHETNLGCILTFHDLSEEKKLEEMKIDFVSMAAHELRTPLTALRGYTSLLIESAGELTPEHKNQLTRVLASSQTLSNLIDNLLNVSRIEQQIFKVDKHPIDIVKVVEKVMQDIKGHALTKQQEINFENTLQEIPDMYADSFRIGEVLTNLLANAMNYSPEKSKVTIRLSRKHNEIQCAIIDQGQGIPPDALQKLFTKFFRVSGYLEAGSKGNGLGLYICKAIIDRHGGRIWADSEVGKGSTFTFTLPVGLPIELSHPEKGTNSSAQGGDLAFQPNSAIVLNKARWGNKVV